MKLNLDQTPCSADSKRKVPDLPFESFSYRPTGVSSPAKTVRISGTTAPVRACVLNSSKLRLNVSDMIQLSPLSKHESEPV